MSEKRLPNVKRSIDKMNLTDMVALAASLTVATNMLTEPGADLASALSNFDGIVRASLRQAFGVNGQGPKQTKREVKSPAVRRALAGIPPVDPVVSALGAGAAFRESQGMTFTEGAGVPKFG